MFKINGTRYVCVNDEVYLVNDEDVVCHRDGTPISSGEFQWDCNDRKKVIALERECAELRFKCAKLENEQRIYSNMPLSMFIRLKLKYWVG